MDKTYVFATVKYTRPYVAGRYRIEIGTNPQKQDTTQVLGASSSDLHAVLKRLEEQYPPSDFDLTVVWEIDEQEYLRLKEDMS